MLRARQPPLPALGAHLSLIDAAPEKHNPLSEVVAPYCFTVLRVTDQTIKPRKLILINSPRRCRADHMLAELPAGSAEFPAERCGSGGAVGGPTSLRSLF